MKDIKALVESSKNDIVKIIRELIAAKSFSLEESNGIKTVKSIMEILGFDDIKISKVGCIAGRVGTGAKNILFDAHVDTVEVKDITKWGFDPFGGKIDNDYIYGRGAAENKGSLGAMLYTAYLIKKHDLAPDCTIHVVASTQEEDAEGILIAETLKELELRPDFACLGKFSNLALNRGHRGRMVINAEFKGKPAHASTPHLGDNALYMASKFISAVEKLNETLKNDDALGKGTIAATQVDTGGNAVNRIPGTACVSMDRRLTAGEDIELAISQLKKLESGKNANIYCAPYNFKTWNGETVKTKKYFPAFLTPVDDPCVGLGEETYENVFGKRIKAGVWSVSSNGSGTFGFLNIPTIGLGAGEPEWVHQTNERVRINDILKAAEFYITLAHNFSKQ
ncbi:MAG: YgeY family selenium metabolism-linked hydrolase [Elusimicrobia bacterium HGW-Elusimicrobia-2]|nr:MAG: YgeY family selenium metabolism-linked hydrolase [Elusimicrobia bacterium HGW-Elusimicrobia-2]